MSRQVMPVQSRICATSKFMDLDFLSESTHHDLLLHWKYFYYSILKDKNSITMPSKTQYCYYKSTGAVTLNSYENEYQSQQVKTFLTQFRCLKKILKTVRGLQVLTFCNQRY